MTDGGLYDGPDGSIHGSGRDLPESEGGVVSGVDRPRLARWRNALEEIRSRTEGNACDQSEPCDYDHTCRIHRIHWLADRALKSESVSSATAEPAKADAEGCFCCCNPYAEPNAQRVPECPIHGAIVDVKEEPTDE